MWFYTKFTLIYILPATLWLVSMADNGTEVISLVHALCMKIFTGQYNTDSENGKYLNFMSVFFLPMRML